MVEKMSQNYIIQSILLSLFYGKAILLVISSATKVCNQVSLPLLLSINYHASLLYELLNLITILIYSVSQCFACVYKDVFYFE
jgi:hypothetical protein